MNLQKMEKNLIGNSGQQVDNEPSALLITLLGQGTIYNRTPKSQKFRSSKSLKRMSFLTAILGIFCLVITTKKQRPYSTLIPSQI